MSTLTHQLVGFVGTPTVVERLIRIEVFAIIIILVVGWINPIIYL